MCEIHQKLRNGMISTNDIIVKSNTSYNEINPLPIITPSLREGDKLAIFPRHLAHSRRIASLSLSRARTSQNIPP